MESHNASNMPRCWIKIVSFCAAALMGMLDHAVAQTPQPEPEQPAESPLHARVVKHWSKLWPHLFDEPIADGDVCNVLFRRGFFCRTRSGPHPDLRFLIPRTREQRTYEHLEFDMTPTRWLITVLRDPTPAIRHRLSGSRATVNFPLAKTMLTRIGFGPKLLASCGPRPHTFNKDALTYSCQTYINKGFKEPRFELIAEIKSDGDVDICTRHPLCADATRN